MTRYRLLKYSLAIFILLSSWSCSSAGSDPEMGPLSADGGEEIEITLPDYPLISRIEAEPSVVSPGQQVTLSGVEGVSGTLTFISPEGDSITTSIEDGRGGISLSENAPAGRYTGMMETEDGALAFSTFRIAEEPGIWLSASQRFVSPGEQTVLSIETYGLPEETVATVYMLSDTGEPMSILVPDEAGQLIPGIPALLSDLEGRPLLLDGRYQGGVQVRVEPAGSEPSDDTGISELLLTDVDEIPLFEGWASNTVQLTACIQSGVITGDIGGEGFVNAVWADGTMQSNAVYTSDGSFSVEAGPGLVLVQSFRVDQETIPEPESQLLAMGCGESLELAQVGGAKVASLASAWTSIWHPYTHVQAPGEFPLFQPNAQSTGSEPCRTGMIFPKVYDADGINISQSTLASLALKTGMNNAANRAMVQSLSDARALADAAAEAYLRSGDRDAWDSAIEAIASMAESDFVINLTAARVGQRYAVETAALPWNPEDTQVRAGGRGNPGALFDHTFEVYTELAEKFRQAAICGSAEPERTFIAMDEEVAIRYRVTDLGGEGTDGASVQISTPKCGRLDPESGTVEGDTFETRFTFHTQEYCAEELEFEAQWSGPQGTLKTKPQETIVRISPQLPELKLFAGAAPGIGNTAALSSAITLYQDYDVQNQPTNLPIFIQDLECGFLEGGLELTNQYYFTQSESLGKRAESLVSFYTSADEVDGQADVPVDRVQMQVQLDTWAIELDDENVIRGAWASGANASDPNLTQTPGTLIVFDIQNPGNLPVTPIVQWQLARAIDDASGYTVLVFYKTIECGDDPGIDSLFSFVGNGDILLESDSEIPGPSADIITLPEFEGDRQQIIMWVTSMLTTASIRDDDSGANIGGGARLNFHLSVNLAQDLE